MIVLATLKCICIPGKSNLSWLEVNSKLRHYIQSVDKTQFTWQEVSPYIPAGDRQSTTFNIIAPAFTWRMRRFLPLPFPLFLISLPILTFANDCSLKYPPRSPLLLPADSSHLWVSWHWGWFEDCPQNPTKSVITIAGDKTTKGEHVVTFSDGTFGHAIIEADPCLKHSLSVQMLNNTEGTKVKVYNEKIDKDLYSGLLGQTMTDACLKDDSTVNFPDPPASITSCIKTRGEQRVETRNNGNTTFKMEILNVDGKKDGTETVCIKMVVSGLKSCRDNKSRVAITNVTIVDLEECRLEEVNDDGVNLAAAILIPLLLLVAIVGVLSFLGRNRLQRSRVQAGEWFRSHNCESIQNRFVKVFLWCPCRRCLKVSEDEDFDKNPTYGDYEYEDGTMRKNTMEMIDQNQDYYEQTMVRKKIFVFMLLLPQEIETAESGHDQQVERMEKDNSEYDEEIFEVCETKPEATENLYQNW